VENSLAAQPIAIFDSGLGGLTVAAEVHSRFPNEDLIFLGDRARVPYASLSTALITRYALECFDYLAGFNPKMMVVACNTVSAVCIDEIRSRHSCLVIDVITPTAATAAEATRSGRIGVLATTATVRRRAYDLQLGKLVAGVQVFSQGCPLFVPLVEEGWTEGEIPEKIVQHYLEPILAADVDTVVLGCTHYEYFRASLQKQLGAGVTLVNTPQVTADLIKRKLTEHKLVRDSGHVGKIEIHSSDITDALYTVAGSLFDLHDPAKPIEILLARTAPREITV
jgi:glutamate racemase